MRQQSDVWPQLIPSLSLEQVCSRSLSKCEQFAELLHERQKRFRSTASGFALVNWKKIIFSFVPELRHSDEETSPFLFSFFHPCTYTMKIPSLICECVYNSIDRAYICRRNHSLVCVWFCVCMCIYAS